MNSSRGGSETVNIAERIKNKQDKSAMLTRTLKKLAELYAEKTHFIYELLQNAEDAEATRVSFRQFSDRLEVLHDGKPFTELNVQSLCDAANSDKIEDGDKIGKFGVGFKSVFTICNIVELYSEPSNRPIEGAVPKFAIKIENYTDPSNIDFNEALDRPYTTKFVFPYQCGDFYKSIGDLAKDISVKLSDLGTSVLLFMKNIKEINYSISDVDAIPDSDGVYMLDKAPLSDNCEIITALGETNSKESDESYLVFSKPIPGTKRSVDLAFSIIEKGRELAFKETTQRFVFVYFPTETESKLNFIVQAPFDLTPNRSSLLKSDRNSELIGMLTSLFREAILEIRTRKWLSLEFINLWPYNPPYGTEWHFYKLHKMALQILMQEQIFPTLDGNYVNAKDAKIVRGAKLLDLFEGKKLCELLNEPDAKWLPKEFTENSPLKMLHQFLIDDLEVTEIGTNELPKLIRSNPEFLKNADDDWLSAFYNYLTENAASLLGKNGDLAMVPFVKTADETFGAPFLRRGREIEPIIFIRPRNANFKVTGFVFVDEFIEQNCYEFLKTLGLTEPNGLDYFIKELESDENAKAIDNDVNLALVKSAVQYLKEGNDKAKEFCSRLLWLRVRKTSGEACYVKPTSEIYREKDINNLSLIDYFTGTECSVYILDEHFYLSGGLSNSDLNLVEKLRIKNSIYEGINNTYWYDGNAQCTNVGDFRKHLNFAHIHDVIKSINSKNSVNVQKQSAIVFALLKNVEKHLSGQWQYGATHPRYNDGIAPIVNMLKNGYANIYEEYDKWLFTNSGALVSASAVSRYELDESLYGKVDEKSSIYELLGLKKTEQDEQRELVNEIISKYTVDEINLFIQNFVPQEPEDEFDPAVDNEYEDFPEEPIKNLQKLRDTIKQRYNAAPSVQYEQVLRRVRTSRGKDKEHIRYRYRGYCQMCEDPSPFWEVVQIFNNPIKELEQMNLSLCPSCAAAYRQLRYNDLLMQEFAKAIARASLADDERIELGEKYNIRFTKAHLAEVQTIINIGRNLGDIGLHKATVIRPDIEDDSINLEI